MTTKKMNYGDAIGDAILLEMRKDPKVWVLGEDVGVYGGVFGVTKAAFQEFGPERVVDTPISEGGWMALAVGAAAVGTRPIAELMIGDFVTFCMDELVNQAAKMRYMFGAKLSIPMVCRIPAGAGVRAAAQHSQSFEAYFAHTPGWKVVYPSNAADAKGLMLAAIRDDNPVMFMEHKFLYSFECEVPEGEYFIPLGKAEVKREGTDVTIVTWAWDVYKSLAAAETLSEQGISVEVIDLRTIAPMDKEAVLASVKKTGRLVIVNEACKQGSFAGEIAAVVADEAFDSLDAPIKRVCGADTPVPFSPPLEDAFLPSADKVVAAVLEIM
jgi:pyruvate/2-oxoglutarate/acetoin dehydrogenase E1 component